MSLAVVMVKVDVVAPLDIVVGLKLTVVSFGWLPLQTTVKGPETQSSPVPFQFEVIAKVALVPCGTGLGVCVPTKI